MEKLDTIFFPVNLFSPQCKTVLMTSFNKQQIISQVDKYLLFLVEEKGKKHSLEFAPEEDDDNTKNNFFSIITSTI